MRRRVVLRWAALALGVAALQGIGIAVYLAVSRSRVSAGNPFRHDDVDARAAPDLALDDGRGRTIRLSSLRGPATLVHLWATWCAPCRTELPSLLALDGATFGSVRLRVVAVSTDERWDPIDSFFGGHVPRSVWRGGPAASRAYGARALPETYVVNEGGTLRARMRGPRDWSSDDARAALGEILRARTTAPAASRSAARGGRDATYEAR